MNKLHEEALSDELYNEIANCIYDNHFSNGYCTTDYFKTEWEDYIKKAAESADITPGYSAKITNDPYYSEPGAGDDLNSYDYSYDDINKELFDTWVNDISRDLNNPQLLRDYINNPDVIDMLRQIYDDSVVPFGPETYEEKIMEYAGEYFNDLKDNYYDDTYDWD